MSPDDLAFLTIEEAARAIGSRQVSPVELTRAVLERIERIGSRLNAYIEVLGDSALAQAAQAETEITRGQHRGPLHGIPVGLKDLVNVAGVRTTGGTRVLGDFVPDRDATVVRRLREAGAIVVGKAHTHELAGGATSDNPHFGPARNPWDPERIPGGSSGGSAIAVAAGLAQATLGSDTGGSVRGPAALCGVVGLKPTLGRVSRNGVLPRCWTMDHVGPLARRVRDAAIVLQAIAGHDPADHYSSRRAVPDYLAACEGDLRGLRLGILGGPFFTQPLDPDVASAVGAAVQVLGQLGASVQPVELPMADLAHAVSTAIVLAEASSTQDEIVRDRPELYGDDMRLAYQLGELISARQYLRALRIRHVMQREFGKLLREVDVLVCPAMNVVAPRLGARTVLAGDQEIDLMSGMLLLSRFLRPFSLVGVPALVVPCGFSREGLPIGLQVVGRPWDEAAVLRVGHAYEQATDWHQRRPPGA